MTGWRGALVCAAAALTLYANALGNPFISDDLRLIATNPTIASPSAVGFRKLWSTDYWEGIDADGRVVPLTVDRNLYRPVTMLSLWLNAALGGSAPWSFRIINVLLHALSAWLVGLLCTRWFGAVPGIIAAAAVLLHPVATDVVNRIVGRADILVLLGVSGALAVQSVAARDGWTWWRAVALALLVTVALGAKESGLIVVPLALVQAWLARGRRGRGDAVEGERGGVLPLLGAVAIFLPLVVYLAARFATVGWPRYTPDPIWELLDNPLWQTSLRRRLPAVGALAATYVRLLLAPVPLFAFYVPARLPSWSDPQVWIGVVVLGAVTSLAIVLLVRRHILALAATWLLASFLVVSQLVTPIGAYSEVRFAYPMLGGLACVLAWCARRLDAARPGLQRMALALGLLAATAAVAIVVARNRDFRSVAAVLEADVARQPNSPAALVRLASEYEDTRAAEAGALYARVTALAPGSTQAWYERAGYEAGRGDMDTAREMYERAVALYPAHYPALTALAQIAIAAGELTKAERLLADAERAAPDDPAIALCRAILDQQRGETAAARRRLEQLVARRPDYAPAVRALAALAPSPQ